MTPPWKPGATDSHRRSGAYGIESDAIFNRVCIPVHVRSRLGAARVEGDCNVQMLVGEDGPVTLTEGLQDRRAVE